MSTASPSPTEGEHDQNSIDPRHFDVDVAQRDAEHERIEDVAALEEGDRVLVGERKRPLRVRGSKSRLVDARGGFVRQHAIEVSGEWDNARTLLLITRISRTTGEPDGILVEKTSLEPVWKVDR